MSITIIYLCSLLSPVRYQDGKHYEVIVHPCTVVYMSEPRAQNSDNHLFDSFRKYKEII